MASLINFVVKPKYSVVKMIFEHSLDTGNGKGSFSITCYSAIRQKLPYGFWGIVAGGAKFKRFSNKWRFVFV